MQKYWFDCWIVSIQWSLKLIRPFDTTRGNFTLRTIFCITCVITFNLFPFSTTLWYLSKWPPTFLTYGGASYFSIQDLHDDVIRWKRFPRYWPFVRGIHRSPVNSPHKGQWCEALMFSLTCPWTNGWVNNRYASDVRHHRAHHDITVIEHRSGVKLLFSQRLHLKVRPARSENFLNSVAEILSENHEHNDVNPCIGIRKYVNPVFQKFETIKHGPSPHNVGFQCHWCRSADCKQCGETTSMRTVLKFRFSSICFVVFSFSTVPVAISLRHFCLWLIGMSGIIPSAGFSLSDGSFFMISWYLFLWSLLLIICRHLSLLSRFLIKR